MTNPTPTRDEVETLIERLLMNAPFVPIHIQETVADPCIYQAASMLLDLRERAEAAEHAEAAAWNDAIEAAADFLHEQAADKGNTKTPQGRTAIFYRRKIRALRRAAPTKGDAHPRDASTRSVLDRAERIVSGQSQQEQRTAEIFLRPTEGEA